MGSLPREKTNKHSVVMDLSILSLNSSFPAREKNKAENAIWGGGGFTILKSRATSFFPLALKKKIEEKYPRFIFCPPQSSPPPYPLPSSHPSPLPYRSFSKLERKKRGGKWRMLVLGGPTHPIILPQPPPLQPPKKKTMNGRMGTRRGSKKEYLRWKSDKTSPSPPPIPTSKPQSMHHHYQD